MAGNDMVRWLKNVRDLMDRLESTALAREGLEARAAAQLDQVLSASRCRDKAGLDPCIAQLRHFWLNGVPWCSELSRALERVLMQYDELD